MTAANPLDTPVSGTASSGTASSGTAPSGVAPSPANPPGTDRARLFGLDPEVGRCPYAVFRGLREQPGVAFDETLGAYPVARYDDIVEVLEDSETFCSADHAGPQLTRAVASFGRFLTPRRLADLITPFELATVDGEHHRRLRGMTDGIFTSNAVRGWEPIIRSTCRDLIARFRGDAGAEVEVEVVDAYAQPASVLSFVRILGLPPADLPMIMGWLRDMFTYLSEAHITREVVDRYADTSGEVIAYFGEKNAALRAYPDTAVLSRLVHAERDGDHLTDREIASLCLGMLAGTSGTTANVIASAAQRLAGDPALAAQLRAAPTARVAAFAQEMIRLYAPVQGTFRTTTRPVRLAGTDLSAGTYVFVLYGSGSRDGAVFPDPDEVDLDRPPGRRHLSMGGGAHRCLGGTLGPAQVRIAVEELLASFTDIAPARPDEIPPFHANLINPGITELRLLLGVRTQQGVTP